MSQKDINLANVRHYRIVAAVMMAADGRTREIDLNCTAETNGFEKCAVKYMEELPSCEYVCVCYVREAISSFPSRAFHFT